MTKKKPIKKLTQKDIEEKQREFIKKMMELQAKKQKGVPGMGNISGVELLQKIRAMQKEMGLKTGKQTIPGVKLSDKELKLLNDYAVKVVQKFGRYIKAVVAFGSSKRKKTSDIDVAILVDDTDVTRMTRPMLKEKLFQRLIEVAYVIDKKIHPQPYLLTEFWEYVRHGNPVLYNVLRTGIPLYDTGFYLPIQMIFKQGLIRPSNEAVDRHMMLSKELVKITNQLFNKKLIYNMEQAVISSGQAVLMEFGYRPPAPKEVAEFLEKLAKEGKIDSKYPKICAKIVEVFKGTEHGIIKEISGKELDEFMKQTKEFVEAMEDVLKKERKRKGETYRFEIFDKLEKKKKVKREGLIDIESKKPIETGAESQKIIEEGFGQR